MAGVGAGSTSFHHHCYCCKDCGKKFAIADAPGEKCFEVRNAVVELAVTVVVVWWWWWRWLRRLLWWLWRSWSWL